MNEGKGVMKLRHPVAVAGIALAVALLAVPVPAVATTTEAELSWSVQPAGQSAPDGREAFDYAVAPGTAITDRMAVTNFSAAPATFRVYAADATTDYDTGAFTLIGSDQPSAGVGAWTSIGSGPSTCPPEPAEQLTACLAELGTEITLGPGERAVIPFTLTVPHDATPGDHAGGIVAVHRTQTTGAEGASVVREDRVGARIYLRVDGPTTTAMSLTGLVAGYDANLNPFGSGMGRVGFDIVNDGNVRLSAQPQIRVTGLFGIPIGTYSLPPVSNLLPGAAAHVDARLPSVPPLLLMFADIDVVPVNADGIAASNDTAPDPITDATVAWAVPWTWLGIIVVLGGGTALLIWWRRRSRRILADDLAAYAEQIRAEERAATQSEQRAPQKEPIG